MKISVHNRHIRCQTLDRFFRDTTKWYNREELTTECYRALNLVIKNEASARRQFFNDVKFMESAEGWKINLVKLKIKNKMCYRYADPNFSISHFGLKKFEFEEIHICLKKLGRYKNSFAYNWVSEKAEQISRGTFEIDQYADRKDKNQFDHLGIISRAIMNKKAVGIFLKSTTDDKRLFHPHRIRSYAGRYMVYGLYSEETKITGILLESVYNVQSENADSIGGDYDYEKVLNNIIGFSWPENEKVEHFELLLTSPLSEEIFRSPIHASQKCLRNELIAFRFSYDLMINKDLINLLMTYAPNLKVEKSEELIGILMARYYQASEKQGSPLLPFQKK